MKKFIFTRTQKEHFGWVVRLPGHMRSYNWRSLSGWPGNWQHGFGLAGWGGWIWVEWNWRGDRDHDPCPSWSWTPSAVSPQSLFQIHIKQIFLAHQFEGPSNWCQPRGPCFFVWVWPRPYSGSCSWTEGPTCSGTLFLLSPSMSILPFLQYPPSTLLINFSLVFCLPVKWWPSHKQKQCLLLSPSPRTQLC